MGTNNASLKNANPDQILNALLEFKKDTEYRIPGCIIVLSMPTKRFDNEKLGKIIEITTIYPEVALEGKSCM